MGAPRTLNDIAPFSNMKRKELARTYRLLILELDFRIPSIDLLKCIARIKNKLNLSEKTKRHALHIMNDIKEIGYLLELLLTSCYW